MKPLSLLLLVVATVSDAHAGGSDNLHYGLQPLQVAAGSYIFRGRDEDFRRDNGGNIVNTGFIVTSAGVVVSDTGPSRRYGEEMRAAIRAVTTQPVVAVFITHHHPDHCFGSQAYRDARIMALPAAISALHARGTRLEENLYRLLGEWIRDTDHIAPTDAAQASVQTFGDHRLRLIAASGHTAGDLAVFDETTGVLFAGDLVFNARAPTLPDADPAIWISALDTLAVVPFKLLVPGHGPVARDTAPITATREYLIWLEEMLRASAQDGLDITEVLQQPVPERFANLAVLREEYPRSVAQRFPRYEEAALHE